MTRNSIVICPTCKIKVLPKSNGTCPNCHQDISRAKPIKQNTKNAHAEIPYKGFITQKDFLKCTLLLYPQLVWQRWLNGIILSGIVLVVGFSWPPSEKIANPIIDVGLAILIPAVLLLYPWWLPYSLMTTLYNQKSNIYRNEIFGNANEKEIQISNSEVNIVLKWNVYSEYKMNEDLLFFASRPR